MGLTKIIWNRQNNTNQLDDISNHMIQNERALTSNNLTSLNELCEISNSKYISYSVEQNTVDVKDLPDAAFSECSSNYHSSKEGDTHNVTTEEDERDNFDIHRKFDEGLAIPKFSCFVNPFLSQT